ncbi:MAG TPA: DMT family transporter [Candidatus Binatia bacterium]|jgi:drug/metabolite transporter (DMT)-like permease|nr:DMT family transporter [Candidatus Binatia bacterium]
MQRSPAKGIATAALTVLALIAFAANSVLCRLALAEPIIDPASYTAVRLITGAVTLWIVAAFRRGGSLGKSGGNWISAAMLFLYAATFSFAYVSLSAGTGALILFAAVQITMIAVGLYTGERPDILEWLGLFIAISGLIYLVSPGITAPSLLGSVLMASAGIAWGIYSLRGRGATDPVGVTTDNFLRTVPFAVALILLWLSTLTITPMGFLWAAVSGSITSGLGYVLWYAALPRLTATRAATVQLAPAPLAALGGVIVLSEAISLRLVVSTVVILGGVGLAISRPRIAAKPQEQSLCDLRPGLKN